MSSGLPPKSVRSRAELFLSRDESRGRIPLASASTAPTNPNVGGKTIPTPAPSSNPNSNRPPLRPVDPLSGPSASRSRRDLHPSSATGSATHHAPASSQSIQPPKSVQQPIPASRQPDQNPSSRSPVQTFLYPQHSQPPPHHSSNPLGWSTPARVVPVGGSIPIPIPIHSSSASLSSSRVHPIPAIPPPGVNESSDSGAVKYARLGSRSSSSASSTTSNTVRTVRDISPLLGHSNISSIANDYYDDDDRDRDRDVLADASRDTTFVGFSTTQRVTGLSKPKSKSGNPNANANTKPTTNTATIPNGSNRMSNNISSDTGNVQDPDADRIARRLRRWHQRLSRWQADVKSGKNGLESDLPGGGIDDNDDDDDDDSDDNDIDIDDEFGDGDGDGDYDNDLENLNGSHHPNGIRQRNRSKSKSKSRSNKSNNNNNTNDNEDEDNEDEDEDDGDDVVDFFTQDDVQDAEQAERERILTDRMLALQQSLIHLRDKHKKTIKVARQWKSDRDEAVKNLEEEKQRRETKYNLPPSLFVGNRNLDDKKRRLQELRRAKARENHLAGEDDAFAADEDDDDGDFDLENANRLKASVTRIKRLFRTFLTKVNFLRRDVLYVDARYGGGISAYFRFFSWMVLSACAISIFFLCLYIVHIVFYFTDSDSTVEWGAYILMPEAFLYGSFTSSEQGLYTALVFVTIVFFTLLTFQKIIEEDKRTEKQVLEEMEAASHRYSILSLNCWDHNVMDSTTADDQRHLIVEKFRVDFDDDRIKNLKHHRTRNEKILLISRRILAAIVTISIIMGTWALIIYIRLNENTLASSTGQYGSFVVNGFVAVINAMHTPIVKLIAKMESWDDPAFEVKVSVTRLFFLKMTTAIIYFATFYYCMLFGTIRWNDVITFFGGSSSEEACLLFVASSLPVPPSNSQVCIENYVAVEFFQFFVTTMFVDMVFDFIQIMVRRFILRRIVKSINPKMEFMVFPKVISVIYKQVLIWFCFPFAPASLILCALLLIFNFKVELKNLTIFMRKSNRAFSAKDTGVFFMIFYSITFIGAILSYALIFDKYTHDAPSDDADWRTTVFAAKDITVVSCGPFHSQSLTTYFTTVLNSESFSQFFFNVVTSPLFIWIVVALFVLTYLRHKRKASLCATYITEQKARYDEDIERLEQQRKRLTKQLDKLKKRNLLQQQQRSNAYDANNGGGGGGGDDDDIVDQTTITNTTNPTNPMKDSEKIRTE